MKIQSYSFGKMIINGKVFNQDLIILKNRIIDNWRRKEGHILQPEDLDEVIEAKPQYLTVGQGAYGAMKISEEAKKLLFSKNIELIHAPTGEAYKIFNQYQEEDKRVAGAFHLTC